MGDSSYTDSSYSSKLPMINIKITDNLLKSGKRAAPQDNVFEVPEDIVNVTDKMDCTNPDKCSLSEFIDIDTTENPEYLVKVMSNSTYRGPTTIWTLDKFERDDFFLYLESQVLTNIHNYQGIMGLTDRPNDKLFLEDGVYSLWTRSDRGAPASTTATANDVHPFYISQAPDMSWFGVYTNLAAA